MSKTKTHWKKLDNPNYLGAYSLMDGEYKELTVLIEKVVLEDVKTERGTDQCKVAYLKGQKPLILNATNCKIITNMYQSPYIEDWQGKNITLYIAKIKAFGETIEAIRVKSTKPVIKLPELTPDHQRWDAALLAISEGNTTVEDIKRNYSLTKKNEQLLCDSK